MRPQRPLVRRQASVTLTSICLTAFVTFHIAAAPAAVLYVSIESTDPIPPFTNWATAAINIQDALDAAGPADEILVTNGVYASGGKVISASGTATNRAALTAPVTLRSVNGP